MKKRKFSRNAWIAMSLTVIVLLCGVTFSYLFAVSDNVVNVLNKAVVTCTVNETFDGNQKSSIKVQNTGNIEAYIRLRLSTHWENTEGKTVAKSSAVMTPVLAVNWISLGNNTYCYQLPVAPNYITGEMLASPLVLQEDSNGNRQVITVFAEAIQSLPADAVEGSWNVTVDADRRLQLPSPPTP